MKNELTESLWALWSGVFGTGVTTLVLTSGLVYGFGVPLPFTRLWLGSFCLLWFFLWTVSKVKE